MANTAKELQNPRQHWNTQDFLYDRRLVNNANYCL